MSELTTTTRPPNRRKIRVEPRDGDHYIFNVFEGGSSIPIESARASLAEISMRLGSETRARIVFMDANDEPLPDPPAEIVAEVYRLTGQRIFPDGPCSTCGDERMIDGADCPACAIPLD